MPDNKNYIIIGNGVAGMTAVESIRAVDKSGSILILTDEKYPFYARLRLPEFLGGGLSAEKLILRKESWYAENGIDLRLDTQVIDADAVKKNVTSQNGAVYSYNKLILATGAKSFVPPIEGAGLEGVFTLRDIADAIAIKEYIIGKKRAIIIGGGLLGLEAGRALMNHGMEISVIEFSDRLLPRQIDGEGSKVLRCVMEKIGYAFYLGRKTEKITRENGSLKVSMHDGASVVGDVIIISAGVRANLAISGKLGLKTNNAVIVNDYMQTSEPDIFAAGDNVEYNGRRYGIWPAAKEQGRVAGANAVNLTTKYEGTMMANALKVAGIDLVSMGDLEMGASDRSVVNIDNENGVYKKYIVKGNALVGCILLGDVKGLKDAERAIKEKRLPEIVKGSVAK